MNSSLHDVLVQSFSLLTYDLVFLAAIAAVVAPLCATKKATYAVLKRNFVGYFSNPTGYVFLCLFVLLTSLAAFCPEEFFAVNLANLDQLNKYLPLIMIVFIPAITMSIWAEERRQGTDELLLTLPADDFEIVGGKYLAAASIFTVSLLFSQISNFIVLVLLSQGDLDAGQFFTTYLGYWFMGLAMLSLGMVASFLTNNLTVSFVLGVLFNAPLAFLRYADRVINDPSWAQAVTRWSLSSQFDDFGRGVVSLSSVVYFLLIAGLGLYLSMILIGARHWFGGEQGKGLFFHYLARGACWVALVFGANALLSNFDVRYDATRERVSSLSPSTVDLIRRMSAKQPVVIDCYVGAAMPERFIRTRYDLINLLKEFRSMSGGKIVVRLSDNLEVSSEQAKDAERRFNIKPKSVQTISRSTAKEEKVLLGAAFSCGTSRKVIEFFEYGVPVEYELVRTITAVHDEAMVGENRVALNEAKKKKASDDVVKSLEDNLKSAQKRRKRIGIVPTDAHMNGGFTFAGGSPQQIPKQSIVDELAKQYDVDDKVDLSQSLKPGTYDVLFAVQPSSLSPQHLSNLVAAIKEGQPTVICEDPLPLGQLWPDTPATTEPKRPPNMGMFGGGMPPQPKGDIRTLWSAIGISAVGDEAEGGPVAVDVVWQQFNPKRQLELLGQREWVHIHRNQPASAEKAFAKESSVTRRLDYLTFATPGAIKSTDRSDLSYVKLVQTGDTSAGAMPFADYRELAFGDSRANSDKNFEFSGIEYAIAMRILGKDDGDEEKEKSDKGGEGKRPINVAYVADIDFMHTAFVNLRNQPNIEMGVNVTIDFENINFLLNLIDDVASESRFSDIRTRKLRHSVLKSLSAVQDAADRRKEIARDSAEKELKKSIEELKKDLMSKQRKIEEEYDQMVADSQRGKDVDQTRLQELRQLASIIRGTTETSIRVQVEKKNKEHSDRMLEISRESEQEVLFTRNLYRILSSVIPPLPPLFLGLIVFLSRRLRERETIAKARRL